VLQTIHYTIHPNNTDINIDGLKERFDQLCVYNSNEKENTEKKVANDLLVAIDSIETFKTQKEGEALNELQSFLDKKKNCWLFGYLSYDLKNEIESLSSANADNLMLPALNFFQPKFVIKVKNDQAYVYYDDTFSNEEEARAVYPFVFSKNEEKKKNSEKINMQNRISKESYIHSAEALKHQIHIGNIYEINFCQEFFAKNADLDPATLYINLNKLSKAPFSAFCKFNENYLISSSPERFVRKKGNRILSQPIKGTIKRSEDPEEDAHLKISLKNDLKERNENVMIVDIVRNDLSKIAKKGSVHVDELFEVYTFHQVHQLISSISCELKEKTSFTDIISSTFPMGSMTGAPKISAMKLIEEFESTKRGLYSGAIGYIDPEGDFDLSVVIRSILYNTNTKYLSFMTGSAITSKSDPAAEYEECLLKAKALFEAIELSN